MKSLFFLPDSLTESYCFSKPPLRRVMCLEVCLTQQRHLVRNHVFNISEDYWEDYYHLSEARVDLPEDARRSVIELHSELLLQYACNYFFSIQATHDQQTGSYLRIICYLLSWLVPIKLSSKPSISTTRESICTDTLSKPLQ